MQLGYSLDTYNLVSVIELSTVREVMLTPGNKLIISLERKSYVRRSGRQLWVLDGRGGNTTKRDR
jgi:hypothetical protein